MKQQIAQKILDQFAAASARVGHCIDERWILHTLRPSLNPKEQMEIDPAIDDLRMQGLIDVEQRMGILALVLTAAGYNAIYPNDPDTAKRKIRQAILEGFTRMSARVGHCLDERWILHTLIPTLTPQERDLIDSAIQEMAHDGLIDTDSRMRMKVLSLTQKGFDAIY